MHKIGIINSKTLLVSIFIEIQPSTCLPELRSPTEGGDSPLPRTPIALERGQVGGLFQYVEIALSWLLEGVVW